MMKCPQCEKVYLDKVLYCLNDGTLLIGDDDEQETVWKQNYPPPPRLDVACSVCGVENPASAKFCQRCGAVFTDPARNFETPQNAYPFTGTGPAFAAQPVTTPVSNTNKNLMIAILAVLSLILVAIILFMASGRGIFVSPDADQKTQVSNANSNSNSDNGNAELVQTNKNKPKSNKPTSDDEDSDVIPPSYPSSLPNGKEKVFTGYSNVPLTLYLTRNGSSLTGTAKTPGDFDYLDGTIDTDGNFSLAGNNQGNGVSGYWRGRISSNGSIKGVWTANNGRRVSFSAN